MDALPLTPNGKLDRKALPAPGDTAYARQAYEPPQGEIEQTLAGIWEELLGLQQVSRHDNFFEVGGHSLIAVQLASQAKSNGLKLNVNQIFQSPQLKKLAKIITESPSHPNEINAIPIRTTGTQSPLFFLPSGTGDYSYAFELARDLNIDLPVYALPWQSIHEVPPITMEVMTARMVAMIRVIQPQGPYRLASYSSGGILAYAVAQHLLNIDQTVSFIGLIDVSLLPEKPTQSPTTDKHMVFNRIESNEHFDDSHKLTDELSFKQLIKENQQLNAALSPKFHDAQDENMFWERASHFNLNIIPSYQIPALPVTIHQFYAIEALPLAQERIFHSDEVAASANTTITELQLPTKGWERVLPISSIHLTPIPGNHLTMMMDSCNRAVLGHYLSEILEAR
nr:thioesterase domain-containing protein [Rhodanobacter sp. DHG33]